MLRDKRDTLGGKTALPIGFPAARDDVVATRAGRAITRAEFDRAVAGLASLLPERGHVINLCTDRYRFMVGFVAALCRRQVTLLPQTTAQGTLRAVAEDYPGLYVLTDHAETSGLPGLRYPERLDATSDAACEPEPALVVPAGQQALVLFTSGSTGRPKPVPKSWGTLVRSALSAGRRLAGAELAGVELAGATVIGTVPHQHSYGLESTILLGLLNGLVIEAAVPFFPGDIRAAIDAAAGRRILVTTPVHLRALVAEGGAMPPVDLIVSATAPLPPDLARQAEACLGGPLIEIYGCTEAGQIATRRTVREEDWRCFDGVILEGGAGGTWASGPAVAGRALVQDVVVPTGAATFRLDGRAADLVDVAGKRTSLAHLNHQLLAIDGVEDGVFVMPDPDERAVTRLAALAVAPALTEAAILHALRERIDAAFLPRPLILVEALPRNALGKLPRAALLERIGRGQGGVTMGRSTWQSSTWQSTGLRFAGDHPTAPGHFPGNPIIPGALLLDAIIAAIPGRPDGDRTLVIRAAKFFRPVGPGAALALRWKQGGDGAIRFECRLADGDAMAVSGTLAPGTARS